MLDARFQGRVALVEPERQDRTCRIWRSAEPFSFQSSRGLIRVPVGMHSDGASVPRAFWWLLPPWGEGTRAALIHDYLCNRINQGRPHPAAPTRPIADAIFLEALLASGVPPWRARAAYAGVRTYGLLVADHRRPTRARPSRRAFS